MLFVNGKQVGILIVEDHTLLIEGIRTLLLDFPQYRVLGHVEDGLSAYHACLNALPQIVLLDLGLPGMDGIDVIHLLKRRWPELIIVVFTAHVEECKAAQALLAGAQGFVLKRSQRQVLLAALKTTLLGRRFLDPTLNHQLVTRLIAKGSDIFLSSRERQVLKLILEGNRNQDIAKHLLISLKTVETHRLNLMRKLNAHNVAELVHWARRLGLTDE